MSRNIIGFLSDEKLKASFPKDAVVLVDTPKPIVYFHHEPECITEQVAYILANWQKFDVIYTWNQEIFDKCPNARTCCCCNTGSTLSNPGYSHSRCRSAPTRLGRGWRPYAGR
jgi:hypothetical protein